MSSSTRSTSSGSRSNNCCCSCCCFWLCCCCCFRCWCCCYCHLCAVSVVVLSILLPSFLHCCFWLLVKVISYTIFKHHEFVASNPKMFISYAHYEVSQELSRENSLLSTWWWHEMSKAKHRGPTSQGKS